MLINYLVILVIVGCAVNAEFSCKTVGNFADPDDDSCQNYYVCSVLSDGTYVKTSAVCSSTTKFDPKLSSCSDAYVCNFNSTTSTTAKTTVVDFQCAQTGRFENPNDLSCTTYYLCSNYYGTYIKTLYKCPQSAYFDPDVHRCTTQHLCATATTTTTTTAPTTTTTVSPAITTEPAMVTLVTIETTTIADFQCTTSGRFENPTDPSCTTYFLCSKYYGSLMKTLYKCPSFAYFDPSLHRCTTQYICPTATTTTTTTVAPSTTTDFSAITTETEMVSLMNITTSTTETTTYFDNFVCTSRGRYANFYDNTCKWYYLCNQLRNGTLLQTPYSCPSNSVFDQSIYKCTTLQDCTSIRNSGFVVTPQFDN